MHTVNSVVLVFLTDSRLRLKYDGGVTRIERYKVGDGVWFPVGKVESEILTNHPDEIVLVVPRR